MKKNKNKSKRELRRERVRKLRVRRETLERRNARKAAWMTALWLFASSVGLLFLCLFIGTQNFSFPRLGAYFQAPLILVLNWLPIALFMAVVYFASNRAWIAWLTTSLFFLLLSFINYFKVAIRGEPLVIDDLLFAGEAAGILDEYSLKIPPILPIAVLLIAGVTVFLFRFARGRVSKKRWWLRVAAIALCILIGSWSWTNWYTDHFLYTNTRLKIQKTFSPWRDEEITAGGGLFWSLLRSLDEAFPVAPEGYSDEKAEEILAETPDAAIPEDQRVNVIVTMLESFSDFSVFDGVELQNDPYGPLHALQEESFHGTLIADSLGGGTINAERAFLTGFSFRQPSYQSEASSFVRYFSANGYVTVGAHPGHDWFYSRDKITRLLGFDEYVFHEGYFEEQIEIGKDYQGFANDELFFADRRADYEQRDPSRPYFSFSVTYQGHSPYDSEIMTGTEYVGREVLSGDGYTVVNNYLNSVADTCEQMAAYVDSFREDEAPVVLVFFGDHKPTLGDGNRYLEQLGMISPNSTAADRYALYSTPYLIWANAAAKQVLGQSFSGQGDTISPCYLMSEIFDCCGWEGPAWLRYQRTLREVLPVQQMGVYALSGERLQLHFNDEEKQAKEAYYFVEFYMRNHVYDYDEMIRKEPQ